MNLIHLSFLFHKKLLMREKRDYDPIKQYIWLLPYNNTSRPLIVPQEYLIHYDDFLLPCNIPTQIVKPLTVIKHLVSSPHDDKDRTYYTALYKQTYSYKELLFISAKTISFMVQAEQKTEHKSHSSPIKNSPDKLSSVLNNRTLRDMTNLLEPYKRNSSETPITTLTHILHCYDNTQTPSDTRFRLSTHHSVIPSHSICFGNYNYSF